MRTFLSRLLDLILRRSREDRLDSEIAHHVEMLTDEMVAGGMPPEEARHAARRQFGSLDRARMIHRDQRGFAWLAALAQDIRFAFRILTRERGFALTAIVVLGVGIGVNNIFFTVVYAHKFRGLPIAHPERILSISAYDDRLPQRAVSLNEFQEMRDSLTTLDVLTAHASAPVTVGDQGRAPDRFNGGYITAGAFDEDGTLGLATVSAQGLKVLARAPILENVAWTPPTLIGKTLYVRDRKSIAAFDLS